MKMKSRLWTWIRISFLMLTSQTATPLMRSFTPLQEVLLLFTTPRPKIQHLLGSLFLFQHSVLLLGCTQLYPSLAPPSPSLINSPTALANPNFNPTIHSTPTPTPPLSLEKSTPINHQLNIGQASTLHATTSNIPMAVSAPTPTPLTFTPLVTHDSTPAFQHNSSQPLPSNNENHTDPTPTSIPLKVSEVFICSAPDFIGDDSLVNFVPQALNPEKVGTDLSLSHAIKQQPSLSKKRSSSSSFDAESSEGVSALN